jgi:hypothetical protein
MAQVAEWLPSKHKTLNSNHSTDKYIYIYEINKLENERTTQCINEAKDFSLRR